jgi:hypothetical protein
MQDLERVERERYGIFTVIGAIAFLALFLLGQNIFVAIGLAISLGLLLSGFHVAKKLTSDYCWALLEAEARLTGHTPSKRRVWLGNLLPGVLVLVALAWLNHAA